MKKMIRIAALALTLAIIAGLLLGCAAGRFKGTYYCDGVFYSFDGNGNGSAFLIVEGEKIVAGTLTYDVSGRKITMKIVDEADSSDGAAATYEFKFVKNGFILTDKYNDKGLFMKADPDNFDISEYEAWCENYR